MLGFLFENWVWILFVVVFVAMHRGGHGCGMHGRDGDARATAEQTSRAADSPPAAGLRDSHVSEPPASFGTAQ